MQRKTILVVLIAFQAGKPKTAAKPGPAGGCRPGKSSGVASASYKDIQTTLTQFVIKVTESKILIDDQPVTKKQLNDTAIDFLMKAGNKYNITIYAEPEVPEARIVEVKKILFFAGLNPDKMQCLTLN